MDPIHSQAPQSLAAAPVGPEFIACFTPALESPFGVGTALTAIPLLSTFIHIMAHMPILCESVACVAGTLHCPPYHLALLGAATVVHIAVLLTHPGSAVLLWVFITAVTTVIDPIAQLPLPNAAPIPTQELVKGTLGISCVLTVLFIAVVCTVVLPITAP